MRTEMETVGRNDTRAWGVPMTLGILLIVGGVFALAANVLTSIVSVYYIAGLLLAVGILDVVAAFRVRRHRGPFAVYFLAGVLAVVCGALILYRPLASLVSLTLLIAGYLFATGLFRGLVASIERYPRWGWDLAYGILTVGLGAYVVASWPLSSFWVLGTVVAAEIIARGFALVAASWVIRDIEHGVLREGHAVA